MTTFKDNMILIKESVTDPEFKKVLTQAVVKAVAVTAAIGITAAIVKHTDSGLTSLVEKIQENWNVNPAESELLRELQG